MDMPISIVANVRITHARGGARGLGEAFRRLMLLAPLLCGKSADGVGDKLMKGRLPMMFPFPFPPCPNPACMQPQVLRNGSSKGRRR